jgi:ABC-type nitrate/sulfonate/bicarbonate transport system substrate-binding protein
VNAALRAAAVATIALLCTAPAGAQPAQRALVLAITARTATAWPLYIASQVGIYAANGLRPDIVVAGSSAAGTQQLTAGAADIADVSTTQIIEAIVDGAPLAGVFDRSRQLPFAAYAVNTNWAKSHGELVVAFLRAYVQSVQWLYDPANRTRAIDILVKETNAPLDEAEKTYDLYVNKLKYYSINGLMSPEKIRSAADLLVKTKTLSAPLSSVTMFYDNRYVQQVNQQLRIR